MKTLFDVAYGEQVYEKMDCYYPDGEVFDTVIWFHGGGLEAGSRKNPPFAEDAVAAGLCLISVEYRLYPQAEFPMYLHDAANAVAFCLANREKMGLKGRIFISGASAGAYLTTMLCLDPTYLNAAGADRSQIAGYISESTQTTVHFNVLRERGFDTKLERIDEAAPLYFSTEGCDYPALLLLAYDDDMPCRAAQNELLYLSLKRQNPTLDTRFVLLHGGHCHGSAERNERGAYDYLEQLCSFIHSL